MSSSVVSVASSSATTVWFKITGAGISKVGWFNISLDLLVAAAVQGTNSKELAVDKGTETRIWSGQVPMPVTMPTNDTLQGRWYTASGEVVTGPVDSWSTDLDVARKERPAKWISGCRLEQSVAATWCRGKINWVSGLKGKPSHEILVARVSTSEGQMNAVASW